MRICCVRLADLIYHNSASTAVTVDLLDSNLILFGSAMSGKTTFLKTLINILHKQFDEHDEQIFYT